MDLKNFEELTEKTDAMIAIYDKYAPVGLDKRFDIDKVRAVYSEMISFIIENIDEAENLKNYLDTSDFWKAPASTRFHGDWESGLCVHSLVVTIQALRFAKSIAQNYMNSPMNGRFDFPCEDIFVAAMTHDFCKADCYNIEYRNTKDFMGNWIKKPFYKTKEDSRALGHGNESVLRLLECMPSFVKRRNVLEAVSRHMGFSDLTDTEHMNYSNFLQNPLVLLIQLADQTASAWWDC